MANRCRMLRFEQARADPLRVNSRRTLARTMRESSPLNEDAGGPPSADLGPVNPIDRDADAFKKAAALNKLASDWRPVIEQLARDLQRAFDIASEVSVKPVGAILGKPLREDVQRRHPGMDVEHVRDALRFRSRIAQPEQITEIVAELRRRATLGEFEILKIDTEKMTEPRVWGWRAIMVDIRLPCGLLVEYYVTFVGMIDASESRCHWLYERGRKMTSADRRAGRSNLRELVEESAAEYEAAWADTAARLGLSVEELDSWVREVCRKLAG